MGVPTFAVLYSLSSDILAARLRGKGLDMQGRPLAPAEQPQEPAQGESTEQRL